MRSVVLLAWVLALPTQAVAQDSARVRKATITYLTSASAYIDAGREGGLQEGMEVQVWRGGTSIGVLKVSYLGPHQASCDIVSQSVAIVVGDTVRFRPLAAAAPPSAVEAAPPPIAAPRPPGLGTPLRGSVGMHYMLVNQVGGGGFTQPSMDVRLNGPLAGSPVVLNVDVRARRTASTIGGAQVVDGHARAYQLALSWGAPTGMGRRLTVGRQTSPGFSGVGIFDGVLGEWSGTHGSGGIFGGTQPDPVDLGFATSIVEAGGYFERHGSIGDVEHQSRWSAVTGLIGSYEKGKANREFGFVQGSFSSRHVFGFLSQEIDYYRPWKRTTGMPAVSFTSTFATLRYRASDALELRAGFDNRQNVLLYRDAVNPVTTFDDAFRQGVWLGVGLRLSPRYFLDADTRRSDGGSTGTASSYTVSLRAARFLIPEGGARARVTYYKNQRIDGVLESVAFGVDPGSTVHVELSGGARTERDQFAAPASQTAYWVGGDLDVNVARAWYLMLSASTEHGGLAPTSQVYTGFSVRF